MKRITLFGFTLKRLWPSAENSRKFVRAGMKPFLTIVLLIAIVASLRAQTVYGIIIGDDQDKNIGQAVRVDIKNWTGWVYKVGQATGYDVEITVFKRSAGNAVYTRKSVMAKINSLPLDDQSIIIVIYNGHGHASPRSKFPMFLLGGWSDALELEAIQKAISARKHHLSLVVSDACNSFLPGSGMAKAAVYHTSPGNLNSAASQNLKELFLGYKGEITVTSSERGTVSYAYPVGAVFTNSFLNACYSEVFSSNQNITWKKVLDKTSKISYNAKRTTPYYEIKLQKVNSVVTSTPFDGLTAIQRWRDRLSDDYKRPEVNHSSMFARNIHISIPEEVLTCTFKVIIRYQVSPNVWAFKELYNSWTYRVGWIGKELSAYGDEIYIYFMNKSGKTINMNHNQIEQRFFHKPSGRFLKMSKMRISDITKSNGLVFNCDGLVLKEEL
ncbi:MAG: hypothetical protein R8G66_26100 [Cytophagales bacterium]|nr:hypothetical protein [Cytophagales bacterium]